MLPILQATWVPRRVLQVLEQAQEQLVQMQRGQQQELALP
jgi:hypothetical protein